MRGAEGRERGKLLHASKVFSAFSFASHSFVPPSGPSTGSGPEGGAKEHSPRGWAVTPCLHPLWKSAPVSPRPKNLPYNSPRSSHGNAGRDGGQWGGTGASGSGLTYPPPGEAPPKGSPPGTTPGVRWTSASGAAERAIMPARRSAEAERAETEIAGWGEKRSAQRTKSQLLGFSSNERPKRQRRAERIAQ